LDILVGRRRAYLTEIRLLDEMNCVADILAIVNALTPHTPLPLRRTKRLSAVYLRDGLPGNDGEGEYNAGCVA